MAPSSRPRVCAACWLLSEEAERADDHADPEAEKRQPPEEQRTCEQRHRAEDDGDFETDLGRVEIGRAAGDRVRLLVELFVLQPDLVGVGALLFGLLSPFLR